MNLSPEHSVALLNLARQTIRAALGGPTGDDGPARENFQDADFNQPAGCFVSLHELSSKRLRGCVGRLEAREPLHLAVADAARSVLEDPRFNENPVTLAELPSLELEISLLSPLLDAPDPLAFSPLDDGIYLTIGARSGCFLPQVGRETGWTRQQLLARLCVEKLELAADAWTLPDAKLRTFSALIIGPEPFAAV